MRFESPVLEYMKGADSWRRLGTLTEWWLCGLTVRRYWNVPTASRTRAVLVASNEEAAGAQRVQLAPLSQRNVDLPDDGNTSLGMYPPLVSFLNMLAAGCGRTDFYGWIEIIR